jgi:hypothetical protein
MDATKGNGHNSRQVAPAKLNQIEKIYFISKSKSQDLFVFLGSKNGGSHDL